MNDSRLAGDTESGIGIETPVCQGGFHLSLSVEACRARYADATTMPIIAALTEIRHCFPCRVGTMQQWEDDEGGWSGCSNERSGQTKMDEKEERKENAKRLESERDGARWKKLREADIRGGESVCKVYSFISCRFFFVLRFDSPFSLSLSLSSSPSLLSSLSLSSMYTTFLPSVRREERLPILRQGQDRDFNQLARFLGPGK